LKEGKNKYSNDGIKYFKNGGNNFALGAVMQCFMVIDPLKEYFVEDTWKEINKNGLYS